MKMRTSLRIVGLLGVLTSLSCSGTTDSKPAEDTAAATDAGNDSGLLRVAVVTGGHAFDVPNFYELLRE